jgi:hypothetical protein
MSKRVYEIARELNLSTKEVIERLNAAGIEVKSHFAVVQDSVYERVFGDSSDGAAPNGRSEVQEAETLPSMIQSPRKRFLPPKVFMYIFLAAALAFLLAASIGAITALIIMQGNQTLPASEKLRPSEEQGNAQQSEKQTQQSEKQSNGQQSEAHYVSQVGKIQSSSVETFLDSHSKLSRYDALTADDVDKMRVNRDTLGRLAGQVDNLDPPQKYRQQYETFDAAINALHGATKLAYSLAADPTAATQSTFDKYDRHVNQAAAYLKKSNEMLGRDYKTIKGVQRVSPV